MISKASAHWSIFEKACNILNDFKKYAGGTLLDIGCGTKPFYEVFEGQVKEYIGLDIPSKIDRPNQTERLMQTDIYGDCLNLPFRSSSVDTVFSSFAIEHVFEYNKYFEEAYRVLKKEGYFIMLSPLIVEIHEQPFDYFRFTKYSLELIAKKHRFKAIHIVPVGGEFLFWGNRIAAHVHKCFKFLSPNRAIEGLSYVIQKSTLYLDNMFTNNSFVCNYLSVFQKQD